MNTFYLDSISSQMQPSKSTQSDDDSTKYGRLIGKYFYHTMEAVNGVHVVLHLNVSGKKYTADVNVLDDDGKDVQYFTQVEPNDHSDHLKHGIDYNVKLDYKKLGLHDHQFTTIDTKSISHKIVELAKDCHTIVIYGMLYFDTDPDLKGIHDIHRNGGTDGAIGFVKSSETTWMYIKFQTQHL